MTKFCWTQEGRKGKKDFLTFPRHKKCSKKPQDVPAGGWLTGYWKQTGGSCGGPICKGSALNWFCLLTENYLADQWRLSRSFMEPVSGD